MTRQPILRVRILSAFTLFIAVLTGLFSSVAPAQQAGAGQPSEGSPTASVPTQAKTPTQEWARSALSGISGADRDPMSRPSKGGLGAVSVGPGTPLFLPAVTYSSGGILANSVAAADLNGDGKLDLVVVNCEPIGFGRCGNNGNVVDGALGVLLGNGDGTFAPPVTYDSGAANATSVVIADVNGDGKPDLVVANCSPSGITGCSESGVVSVLLGNGDGTFRAAVTYGSGGVDADSVKVADVNGDGKPDIVVASFVNTFSRSTSGILGVLLGNGDGTFQNAVAYPSGGSGAISVAVADVNGDNKLDLVVGNADCPSTGDAQCVGVLLGNGDGTFQPVVTYKSGGGEVTSVAVADLNGDGKPDLLVTNFCISCANTVGVLLGNGDGTFQAPVTYGSGGYQTWSAAVADVNGDGKPDLLVANQCTGSVTECSNQRGAVGVLLNNGDGTFQQATTYYSGGDFASFLIAADVDGDGKPDMVVVNQCLGPNCAPGGTVGVLLGDNAPSTTLVSNLNPSIYGQRVTWTATVTASGSVPTGKVNFMWDGYSIGLATLNADGAAMLTLSGLNADTYPLVAAYLGDGTHAPSTSAVLNQVIDEATSSATLSSSPNPSTLGQTVTFTATITSPTATPTGPVTFTAGKTVLGTAQLSGGKAKFTTSTLAVGSTKVTATFSGDSNISGSSASVTQTVQQ